MLYSKSILLPSAVLASVFYEIDSVEVVSRLVSHLRRMADFLKLRESDIWRRKAGRGAEAHDSNKSGDITRANFELVVNRYQKLDTATPQYLQNLSKFVGFHER